MKQAVKKFAQNKIFITRVPSDKNLKFTIQMNYKYTATTQAGDGRTANEDFIGVHEVDGGILAIVCDGVGISSGTNIAAKLCVASIQENFCSSDDSDYLKRIKTALSSSNEMLRKYSDELAGSETLVTTADVLFLHKKNAYWGHIGDSRIYNIKNGTLHRMTKDHSLVQQLIDEGFLTMKERSITRIEMLF